MKKIFLFILIVISVSAHAFPGYTRVTKNGGISGYNKTYLKVDKKGNTKITCSGPGYEPAPLFAKETDEQHKELVNYAVKEIASGNLKGSYTKNGIKLIWKSDDTKMTNSTITIK
jgi:hypothetical protein